MNEKRLTEAITEGGIPWINFFNGRLLSGEDLSKEQDSNLKGRRRLGLAIGEGVANGLEVSIPKGVNTRETPYVVVERGLAINRQGQTVWLENQTNVKLTRPVNAGGSVATDLAFDDCQPLQPGVYVAQAGVYLLTIAPARKNEGRAAVSGLDNIIARCNTHHAIEGAQFRLIQLGLNAEELGDTEHLRNIVAYKCFGIDNTKPAISFPVDPLGITSPRQTLLDDLRPRLLTDCDVPLALINWTSTEGIKFVDMWSVRRRVFAPSAATEWQTVTSEERSSVTEAMILQFADHLKELRAAGLDLESMAVTQHFNYLPPMGLLPVSRLRFGGVIVNNFFSGFAHREPEFIDGKLLRVLLKEAVHHEPIDLSQGEMVWLYKSWQNEQVFVKNESVQPYVIFASAQMPYLWAARFDVARWNLSNYACSENC